MGMLRKLPFAAPIFFLLSIPPCGFAGQDAPKKADPAPDYSKESSIILSEQTPLRFSADGSSVRTQTTSVKMLSEAGVKEWGVLGAAYASENEHLDVHYVRVHKADGATVVTPAANVLDLPSGVTREAPMYSDLKQKQIPVKALGVGDTLEYELAFVEDKPLVPGQFWYSFNFTRNAVVLKEAIEVRVPRDKLPKIANAGLKPVVTDDGAERVYTWTTSNAEPTKPAGTGDESEKQEQPDVQFSTFQSWRQVGEWYDKLAQSQAAVTPEIQARADALVKGIAPGPARIQAIYDFVSSHIRYIGLSFGIGRFQPHTATDVLENEYCDCKDKHTLLAALLKAEGLAALKSAAEGSTDPAMLSSIAATLADAGKALDLAQHAAQRALTLIENETANFSLDAITNPQMRKMTDLAQIWDRMSWVAFKAGDLAVAEKYALAAWTLAQEPAAGDHLGQIYEKQGKLTQALDVYKMARARAYPPVPGLEERDNALRKRVGSSASNADNGVDRLQKMRIVHLPRLKPLSASADFLVLFAGGKVSEVKMLGGDQNLEPYGSLLKQARFTAPFPDQGPERVVRQGVLSCSAYDPDCMFLMMLPADASTYSRSPDPIHSGEIKVIHVQP